MKHVRIKHNIHEDGVAEYYKFQTFLDKVDFIGSMVILALFIIAVLYIIYQFNFA